MIKQKMGDTADVPFTTIKSDKSPFYANWTEIYQANDEHLLGARDSAPTGAAVAKRALDQIEGKETLPPRIYGGGGAWLPRWYGWIPQWAIDRLWGFVGALELVHRPTPDT